MSEEKLYVVKNDEGKYLLDSALSMDLPEWTKCLDQIEIFAEKSNASYTSENIGGHVVALVEERKPEVVSPEEAEILEKSKMESAQLLKYIGKFKNR